MGAGSLVLLVTGACLFFFSFAVFCAMFTGHILRAVFYAILNFLVVVVSTLLENILSDSLYGFDGFSRYDPGPDIDPCVGNGRKRRLVHVPGNADPHG